MAMVRTQIYLTEEQRQHMQRLAAAQHRTMAELIREAIEAYMTQQSSNTDPLWDLMGLGASGISDGSIQHDRDLYSP